MVSIKQMALALHVCCTCLASPFHKVIQLKTVVVTCTSLPERGAAPPRVNHNICLAIFRLGWLVVLVSLFSYLATLLSLSIFTNVEVTDVVSIACFGRFLPFLYLEMTCSIVHTGEIRTLSGNVTIAKDIYTYMCIIWVCKYITSI